MHNIFPLLSCPSFSDNSTSVRRNRRTLSEGLRLAGDSPPSLQHITEAPPRKALVDGSAEEVPVLVVVKGSTELELIERFVDQVKNYVVVVLIEGRSRTDLALDTVSQSIVGREIGASLVTNTDVATLDA